MAVFNHVASNASQTAVSSLAFSTAPTAGNSLFVCISWTGSQSTPTCASSNGNTYVLAKLELDATHNYGAAVFVAHNCVGGAETVTPSETSVSNFDILLAEYAKGTNVLQTDKTASDHQSSADPNSGNTAVTSAAAELVFGFVAAAASTPTAGTGFTGRVTGGGVFNTIIEDKVVSSTGAQAAAFTAGSQNWLCVCVTLMETAGGTNVTASVGIETWGGQSANVALRTDIAAGLAVETWNGLAATVQVGGAPTLRPTNVYRGKKRSPIYGNFGTS